MSVCGWVFLVIGITCAVGYGVYRALKSLFNGMVRTFFDMTGW